MGVIGAGVFHVFVAPRAAGGDAHRLIADTARRIGFGAALTLVATVPLKVILQAKNLAFEGDPWGPMVPRVIASAWGHALAWQVAAALIAASGFTMAGRGKSHGWIHAGVAAVVIAIVPAFMGHAGAMESWRWGAVATDAIHVAAAGAWAGGLAILTLCAIRLRRDREGGIVVASLIDAFHRVAKTGVITLICTGIISAKLNLINWSDLVDSHYGEVLVVKVALVAIALFLGWRHSTTGASRSRASGAGAVSRSLAGEWVVMALVLLATGLLAGSPPPGTD